MSDVTVKMLLDYLSNYDGKVPVMWSGEAYRVPDPPPGKLETLRVMPLFLDRVMAELGAGR